MKRQAERLAGGLTARLVTKLSENLLKSKAVSSDEDMWEFPSNAAFIGNNAFLMFWLAAVAAICLTAWGYIYFSIRNNTKDSLGEFLKNAVGGAFFFLVLFFVSYQLLAEYNQVKHCRNLDLQQVKAMRVTKMANENSVASPTIRIEDARMIRDGLELLKTASGYDRRKKRFIYGYRVELILENNPVGPVSLYYFAETQTGEQTNAVILSCGDNSDSIETTDDVYSSSNFGEWLRTNIEPLFKEVQ